MDIVVALVVQHVQYHSAFLLNELLGYVEVEVRLRDCGHHDVVALVVLFFAEDVSILAYQLRSVVVYRYEQLDNVSDRVHGEDDGDAAHDLEDYGLVRPFDHVFAANLLDQSGTCIVLVDVGERSPSLGAPPRSRRAPPTRRTILSFWLLSVMLMTMFALFLRRFLLVGRHRRLAPRRLPLF